MEQTPQREQLAENDIRVSFKTDIIRAVERVEKAFQTFESVKFSAINSGISRLIVILEIAKVKIEGLHQINIVETLTTTSTQDGQTRNRYMTAFRVELSKSKPKTIPAGYFYQAPYTKEHIEAIKAVKASSDDKERPFRGGRGRGRGGRGRGGRGRGGRGRGRGGFQGEHREFQGEHREFQGERREFQGERREFQGERREFQGEQREGQEGQRGGRGRGRGGRGRGRGFFGGDNGDRQPFRGGRGGARGSRGSRGGFTRGGSRGGNAEQPQQERPQTVPAARGNTIPGLGNRRN